MTRTLFEQAVKEPADLARLRLGGRSGGNSDACFVGGSFGSRVARGGSSVFLRVACVGNMPGPVVRVPQTRSGSFNRRALGKSV